ncbi:PGF-CTERM sorting domain-containing protein [Natronorubrum sp. A-ect3]|uniref:PGF-CTERM sorting domain-containing protein n=1 Tax=Natronorubrum sp. A-ect3 TaxID=3242698 RepID=UPI00359DFAF4
MVSISQLSVLLVAAMVAFAMVGAAAPAGETSVNPETNATDDAVQTLEHGEDLYFVFGAELENQSVDEFIEAQMADAPGPVTDQEEIADIVQYQDVEQVDFNQQGGAISIAIDGGEATAIQEANQQSANSQVGEATAENTLAASEDLVFENVGDVHIVFGNGDRQEFDGWSVADQADDDAVQDVSQPTEASTTQDQDVDQVNYNDQSIAVAISEGASEAVAYQRSTQTNQNRQQGTTTLHETGDAGSDGQSTEATVNQSQRVSQANQNQQGMAVAIAVGEGSVATAIQITDQTNFNEQLASTETISILEAMSGMNVATAAVEDNNVVTTDGDGGVAHDSGEPEVSVTQYQNAEQVNVNLQSAAVAIALNQSDATAIQLAEQRNYNEQVGVASVENVGDAFDPEAGAVITNETTVTVGENDGNGTSLLALDYDGESEQLTEGDQYWIAELDHTQFVNQKNSNQQQTALAIAEDNGSADASQITMQENRNVQFADAEQMIATPDNGSTEGESDTSDEIGGETPAEGEMDNDDKTKPADGKPAKDAGKDKVADSDDKPAPNDTVDGTGDGTTSTDDPDSTVTADDEADDSMPGLGVGVALVAILVAALVASRNEH